MTTLRATEPIIRAKLSKVSGKRYETGILGMYADARWSDGSMSYDGKSVSVVPCPSVLAVWEAIQSRSTAEWTVVLTPVDEEELGAGILAHLIDGRLMTPDPWDALKSNFSATTIEPALYRVPKDRQFAEKLLGALNDSSYTPAPGGVLTRDHAMTALALSTISITDSLHTEIDALAVLEWSYRSGAQRKWASLCQTSGAELCAPFADWLAERAGRLGGPVRALLDGEQIDRLIPLGIVAGLFAEETSGSERGLGLFHGKFSLQAVTRSELAEWSRQASALLTSTMLESRQQIHLLDTAAAVVNELGIGGLAESSTLLKHGLDTRIDGVCAAIDSALNTGATAATRPIVATSDIARIEARSREMSEHFLARSHPSCLALGSSVRLLRWLASQPAPAPGIEAAAHQHLSDSSWVDSALIVARRGADSPTVTATLRRVIEMVSAHRLTQDKQFAAALADAPQPSHLTVERVVPELVAPLAHKVPTLLIVVDALSVAAANDVVAAATLNGWTEIGVRNGDPSRHTALAVLPTLTQRSRCSLLAGELVEGNATKERSRFVELLRSHNLAAAPGVPDPIFHKQSLDSVIAGASLATSVSNAIADTEKQPLVAAVLNYVDDTLHHTDPGGTDWTIDTITHLRALLHAAQAAGRAVVITSDHGHVIDHGNGKKLNRSSPYGLRAHGDIAAADSEFEVVVRGPRVMTDSKSVVLAVDERVRYGNRCAGYHGGAAPAEVLVPVYAIVAGVVPQGYLPVGIVEPAWWTANPTNRIAEPVQPSRTKKSQKTRVNEPGLFDAPEQPQPKTSDLAARVVASKVFTSQVKLAGRIVVTPEQIRAVLDALINAPAHELTTQQAAAALSVSTSRINGALMQVKRVLDVEGYEVLEVASGIVILHEATLREQFGVAG